MKKLTATLIGVLIIFACMFSYCKHSTYEPEFLFSKLPADAIVINRHFSGTPRGDFIAIVKIQCSLLTFERYLNNLKFDAASCRKTVYLPWDVNGIEWWDFDDSMEGVVKWYYYSDDERRKIVAAWFDGMAYLQYETF
jgi:hypothetical protein